MEAVRVMLRFGAGVRDMCFATAWAVRKEPVVLTSIVLRHWVSCMSRAGTQSTIPAKQKRWSMLPPRVEAVFVTASAMEAASVTSTAMLKMRVEGKSEAREVMVCWELRRVDSRSQRQRPEAPCSRRARAVERARVPAPPVTGGGGMVSWWFVRWREDVGR